MERFYSKVNQTVHNRNLLRSNIATEEQAEAELEKKTVRDAENKIRKNATRAEYVRRLRADRAAEAIQITSDLEPVVEFLPEQPARISTKTWSKRPAYWESIADFYSHCGKKIDEVLDVYDKEFEGYNNRQAKKRVEEWVRNQKSNKKVDYQRRSPSYGKEVDLELLSAVKERSLVYCKNMAERTLFVIHGQHDSIRDTNSNVEQQQQR